jgi:hypothetical protein
MEVVRPIRDAIRERVETVYPGTAGVIIAWAWTGEARRGPLDVAAFGYRRRSAFPHSNGAEAVFERFTDRAQRVVSLAGEQARTRDHHHVDTGHILLGLIDEGDGVGVRALARLDISPDSVRQRIEGVVIGRSGDRPLSGTIPFTPRAKKVFEYSLREALQLGHNYIGTEHILLGLIREGGGVAAEVLVSLGADLNTVRHRVVDMSDDYRASIEPRRSRAGSARTGAVPSTTKRQAASVAASSPVDAPVAELRPLKEAAIDAQDFERPAQVHNQGMARLELPRQSQRTPGQVFICYRRDDSAGFAGRIFDELVRQLGANLVFMDVDSIEPGRDFVEASTAAIASAEFVVVVIGPRWLQLSTEDGSRRIDADGDYVRHELETALGAGKRIVPALVDGATMPRPEQLPASVAELARRNAVRLDHTGFHDDLRNLLKVIRPAA